MGASAEVSRRNFLKGAGAAGLGVVSLATLASCGPKNRNDSSSSGAGSAKDVKWDEEYDVVVVGSGTAAYAAVFAKDFGADKVCILEKNGFGGTAKTSGGVLWVPQFSEGDTRQDAINYLTGIAGGRGNTKAIEAYVDNAADMCKHMNDEHGWNLIAIPAGPGFFDYYDDIDGFKPAGRQVNLNGGAGPDMWAALNDLVTDLGIDFKDNTPATNLVVDDNGRVVGVEAGQKGRSSYYKANKAVVLGTGGFDNNPDMLRAYQTVRPLMTCASPNNTGDGQIMGAAIGAQLGGMDTNWGLPAFYKEPYDPEAEIQSDITFVDWGTFRAGPGCIIVNKQGKRFGDESALYAPFNRLFENFDTTTNTRVNLPAIWICDSNYIKAGGGMFPGQVASDTGAANNTLADASKVPDNIFQADTLDEIADHFGINAANLNAEVEKVNGFAQTGVDSDFHRGEHVSGQNLSMLYGFTDPEDFQAIYGSLPNPVLGPLDTPPYYASLYVPGTCGTNGGLVINENAQVLDTDNKPIDGLYAVGNCTASIFGGQYPGGGATLGSGSVESYLAMKNALQG